MKTQESKEISRWLFVLAGMVFGMTVLGGITRLTGSGLSMVQWAPILGWIPPIGQAEWDTVFAHYQTSPEFREINAHLDLEGFKNIFWLEYFHRLWGRLIGVVFLLPFLYFLARKRIAWSHVPRLVGMFLLGGAQGVMGWYMVKSGLVDVPHVSPYRLAAHLGLGFVIFAYILWTAMDFYSPTLPPQTGASAPRLTLPTVALAALVFLTALSGAFVAGTHAGLTFNTFPLMDGHWIPENYWLTKPFWLNALENIPAIQWNHRFLALSTFGAIVIFWFFVGRHAPQKSLRMSTHLLLGMVVIQVALGIATLLTVVPVSLASAHQAGAMILFGLGLLHVRQWRQRNIT